MAHDVSLIQQRAIIYDSITKLSAIFIQVHVVRSCTDNQDYYMVCTIENAEICQLAKSF